jgi:hypothetical protein
MVDKLNDLEVAIANKPQVGGMSEEIQKYIAFKKTMVTLAEAEGLTKKDITDSSGKVNWAKLSDKLIDTAGQIGQAFAQRQPPQRDVQPMNVPDVDIMQPEVPVEEVAEVSEGLQQAGATTSSIGLPGQRYKKQEERVAPQVLGAIPEAPGIGDEVEVLTPEEVEEMRAAPSPALEVVEEAPIVEPDVEVLPSGYWRDKRGMLRQDGRAGVIGRKEEGAILQSLHTKAEQEQQ